MTDNCPKLFKIDLKYFPESDVHRLEPTTMFSFGFGFSGSALVGLSVKEMLSISVSSLNEVRPYDVDEKEFKPSLPSLLEIAHLVQKIAHKYISMLGVCYPDNCRCEFVVFGFCFQSRAFKMIRIFNSPESPAEIKVEDCSENEFMLLGDKKEEIAEKIRIKKNQFTPNSLNWWRAPFITLSNIVRENSEKTIGGYMQFCIAYPRHVRSFFVTSSALEPRLVGFDLFREIGMLGSFVASTGIGMSLPNENGW